MTEQVMQTSMDMLSVQAQPQTLNSQGSAGLSEDWPYQHESVPTLSTVHEAVKYVQQTKLIPAIPQFITDGLTGADVVKFNQYLQAGVLSSFNIEVVQGLVQTNYDPDMGGVVLRITQLIAGFLIGPRGLSIRDLAQGTGCVIKSWTEDASIDCPRDTRVFVLEGSPSCVLMCLDVVIAAIDRYKDLAEGRWSGQYVNKTQKIKGFVFVYYPPPKDRVPMAAGIKGFPPSSKQAVAARSLLGLNPEQTYQTALQSICAHMAGPMSPPIHPPTSTTATPAALPSPAEEVDDLGSSYGGIYPGRVYTPKVDTRGTYTAAKASIPLAHLGLQNKPMVMDSLPQMFPRTQIAPNVCEVCSALAKGMNVSDPFMFSGGSMCNVHKEILLGLHPNSKPNVQFPGLIPATAGMRTSSGSLYDLPSSASMVNSRSQQELNIIERLASNPEIDNNLIKDIYKYLSEISQNRGAGCEDPNIAALKATLSALSTSY
eukprot:TRINITY_DN1989_c0_g1_i1.p1 TRINITY_DN1989_c0_g1~~TRINITY_DN1989_c0_g1_i1.p1  ORF type:complete len:485 (+),score=32.13 TRINITY_DN1989_c0_g1_i1:236-1690(+)